MTITLQHFRNTIEILPSISYTHIGNERRTDRLLIITWLWFGLELSWSREVNENT